MRYIRENCLVFLICFLCNAANVEADTSTIRFEGGSGLSKQTAVVILGARDEMAGIAAESDWATRAHPTWRKAGQALIGADGRSYDQIDYDGPDGPHVIWFDITAFFGKF